LEKLTATPGVYAIILSDPGRQGDEIFVKDVLKHGAR